ncbi:MAG: hypothetical protein IJ529_01960 [Alphaproteobacteria bacterium]|nr:hypothetical protein [Alphaproteobacteria bacterium]MBR1600024.1 hypothetical protein [Alphaproteobacteria bacterium]MBR1601783.1 hypothetical protein [Alphaproteobacteria bacterium]
MWLSIKKYALIIKALSTLADRPYLAQVDENDDGTVTFNFVQGDKIYRFTAVQADVEDVEGRVLN